MPSITQTFDAATAKILADARRVLDAAASAKAGADKADTAAKKARDSMGIIFDSLGFSQGGLYYREPVNPADQPTESVPVDMSDQPTETGPAADVGSIGEGST